MSDSTLETALGGAKIKTICDNLTRVGFDWRAMCVEALLEAHMERARPIERAKETQKCAYISAKDLGTFVRAVIAGTARVAFYNPGFVKKFMADSGEEALDAIEREVLARDNAWEFAEAMGEYNIQFSWSEDAIYAVHRLAPPWKDDVFEEIGGVSTLDAACCLGVDVIQIKCDNPAAEILLDEKHTVVPKWPDDRAPLRATETYMRARKIYAFAKSAQTLIGVTRDLLNAPCAHAHNVSYPKDTAAAMSAGALFVVTDDATWGQLLLGKIEPVTGSPTAEFLAKFRAFYKIEPADNPGGVVCCRRE